MSCDENVWQPRPAASTEYVWASITAQADNGATLDPTSDNGYYLFQPEAALTTPAVDDDGWTLGTWRTLTVDEQGNDLDDPIYQLGALVGSTDYPLTKGRWIAYTKLTDSPEVPIRPVVDDRGTPKVLILT